MAAISPWPQIESVKTTCGLAAMTLDIHEHGLYIYNMKNDP